MPFNTNVKSLSTSTPDGVKIDYYDSDPEKKGRGTIVLLHGTAGSAQNNFWALYPMLSLRHRVVALDFVDPEDATPEAETYVRQVHAVVSAADQGEPVHLVGYSFGAVIAALYAAQHGAAVRSLTLVCGWVKTDNQQRLRNTIWRSLYESKHDAIAEFSVFANYSQPFLNAKNESELKALVDAVRTGPDRSKKMAFNLNVDISRDLGAIGVPSLVVGCTLDLTTPMRHARMLFGGIADSRFAEIYCGHGVVHERPAELFTMIDEFVQNPAAQPAGHVFQNAHA
ncbi:alpha/beta hydrolase [Bordetella genomosp. 1]|uniref:Alpha/beta hydrolase n=1 Tax=Bordetella genomosp. 1 TaxID=1395607 RepID=A0A261S768_9BORD|nr:alpha/beta hydrolase [Bordetella genomosp. 1]OZI33186.1 alpha/beta hydrolase [Bordetella genomosp. 1]